MKAIVLAAGFGTRLYPLTENKPKALLELGGTTLLDHLMKKIETIRPIREVVIVTSGLFYLDFFRWRKKVQDVRYTKRILIEPNKAYVPEKREGAVRDLFRGIQALRASEQGYLILCADNYFDFPLSHFLLPCMGHQEHAFVGIKDVASEKTASKYGVVEVDEHSRITTFEEKPERPKSTLASVGVYYLPSKFQLRLYEYLEIEKRNPDRLGDFVGWLTRKEEVYGVEFDGTWIDIGTPEAYENARRLIEASAGLKEVFKGNYEAGSVHSEPAAKHGKKGGITHECN